jgi:hypothetical protein
MEAFSTDVWQAYMAKAGFASADTVSKGGWL